MSVVNRVNESTAWELVKFSIKRKSVWQECQALWERPAGFYSGGTDAPSLLQCGTDVVALSGQLNSAGGRARQGSWEVGHTVHCQSYSAPLASIDVKSEGFRSCLSGFGDRRISSCSELL